MAMPELQTTREQLSRPEEARIAHETAIDIANNLLGIPEFNAALGKTFFGRSFPNGGRAIIDGGVFFNLEGFGYHVSFHGEPLRFSAREVRNYSAMVRMDVKKYGAEPEEGADRPRVASLSLYSAFTEDQNGEVKEYKTGHVTVEDESGKFNGSEAVDKINENFGALYPSPVSL